MSQNKKKAVFDMPSGEFCYEECGNCIYYDSGYCSFHKTDVSSSDTKCPRYKRSNA